LIEVLATKDQEHLIKDYYVKLQIVLSEGQLKNDIELEDILSRTSEDNKKILMLGNAGVGKTTLMQYIANKWGNDNLWQDKFDYVYKISFKQLLLEDCKDFVKTFVKDEPNDPILQAFIAYNIKNGNRGAAKKSVTNNEITLNDKTLLLIDGYDEVKHLDEVGIYKSIKDSILSQTNVIMTSRPNAIDQSLKQNFSITIENVGLDEQGIGDYLGKYFHNNENQQIKQNIENFLLHNPNIAEICKIPVNIAMLCAVWSDTDENSLSQIISMGDLYDEMVKTLGKRYIEKLKDHEKYNSDEKVKKAIAGIFYCNELKILEHLAHYNFTKGDSLIFAGSVSEEDTQSTSIQSAINRLEIANKVERRPFSS
jgi:predicted NACHT family NTPase